MSQWIDAQTTASLNSGAVVNTDSVGWNNYATTQIGMSTDKKMLYWTAAGVILSALLLLRKGR